MKLVRLEWLLFFSSFCIFVNSRKLPDISSFEKKISIDEDRASFSIWPPVTENESFVYAICDVSDPVYFREKHCNVSIETPALSNATFKDTCLVKIQSDTADQETLSNLKIQPFGDDKIVFSWSQGEWIGGPTTAKLKIVHMSNCKFIDVTLPTDSIPFIVSYGNTLDVGLRNENYCGSVVCKIRLNSSGEIIDGPTRILSDINLLFYYALTSIPTNSEEKGFYLSVVYNTEPELYENLFKINSDGTKTRLMSFLPGKYSSYSTSHDHVSVCTSTGNTTITCYQFYSSLNLLTNRSIEFQDQDLPRWFQPHNLRDGGLLLVTGKSSDVEAQHYDSFGVIKLFPNGRKGRALTIDGLNFTCRRIQGLFVVVTENDYDEFCFNFSCSRSDAHQFASKCVPRSHIAMPQRSPAILN